AAMAKDLKLMGRILKKLVVVDINQILYIVGSWRLERKEPHTCRAHFDRTLLKTYFLQIF
ncbi:MAG: hypothetical protein ACKOXN_03935, partial [Limnohabitans sp.]